MVVVGLTGGMGSGKSTVAAMFRELGAHVIDADAVARAIVEPGEPALAEIAARFGDHLLVDGALDRAGLAAVVFGDAEALEALNAITHPRIAERIRARIAELHDELGDDDVILVDHPLLIETGQSDHYAALVVVLADAETRVRRLEYGRGIDPEDARARMASQASDEDRRRAATHLIVNDGTLQDLAARVAEVHGDLRALAASTAR